MKFNLFHMGLIIGIAAVVAGDAFAQSANSEATSSSQSGVSANVQGFAGANNVNTFQSAAIPTETTVNNVPAVSAPGIITAYNCGQGISGGAAIAGAGISLGGTYTDKNCERIAQAAAINTLAGREAALYHLAAGDVEVCKSLRATGVIAATSQCGDDGASAGTVSTRSAAPAPTRTVAVAYSRCEARDTGAIVVQVKYGKDRETAIAQCRARLGM